MLSKDTQIFASFHPSDKTIVMPMLEQIRLAGWGNIDASGGQTDQASALKVIQQSGMALVFLSNAYAQDDRSMLEEFAYAATVVRKPFIPVWLDSLVQVRQNAESDQQLLSALEMLTAKNSGTTADALISALQQFAKDDIPYTPSTPQICEKPAEAYEGDEPYIFISYAHDDASKVYPIIKELYETGWDLWYDEGIKITERYLPVIAHHVKRCSVFVLMLTNRCMERPFVMNYELEYARRRGIPIIPVLLEELEPQPWSQKNIARLMETVIPPNTLLERISTVGLTNQGTRIAVPPAIKHNVVYDVVLPPELPGFRFTVRGEEITITRYIGNEKEVVIPGAVKSLDGSVTFRITVIDDYAFAGGGFLIDITIPEGIRNTDKESFKVCKLLKSVVIPDTVTSIGKSAFCYCKYLTSIIIPKSVLSIGSHAFSRCESLNNITITNSIKSIGSWAFINCKSLTSIVIPDSIISIEDYTFCGCKSLADITIPDSITSIGDNAFAGCSSLIGITIPDSVQSIGSEAFKKCILLENIILPESITDIGAKAFSYCPKLNAILDASKTILYRGPENWDSAVPYHIPDGVKEIKGGAFSSSKRLPLLMRLIFRSIDRCRPPEAIIIPNSVTEINNEAFMDSKNLKNIIIPDSVTSIGEYAFWNCESLNNVIIPNSVTSIESDAFRGCKSLTSITVPDSVSWIASGVFRDCKNLKNATVKGGDGTIVYLFSECTSLTNVTLSDKITCIGELSFLKCMSLKSIVIPDSVTSIDGQAFEDCISLETVIIPDSVTSIGEKAFWRCKSLKNIVIPDSVIDIGYKAFGNTPVELTIPDIKVPDDGQMTVITDQVSTEEEINQKKTEQFRIPICHETPRAKICCAMFDVNKISTLLTELYWEGFNLFLNKSSNQQEIEESQCVLVFISNDTGKSEQAMDILKKAVQHDVSRIIQVFLGDCTDLPDEVRDKLHDRQAIIQRNLSEQEFTGKIRDSLRQFECNLGHPRGFDIKNLGDSVEIVKFHPTNFPQVIIPRSFLNPPLPVTSIGATAFMECETLTSITIPYGVKTIEGEFTGGAFSGCENLTNVTIPDSVTSIGENAFLSCSSLRNITIPHGVVNIGKSAFSYCESLSSIIIPDGITHIADMAFTSCEGLIHIIIPNSVTHIGDFAFSACKSLKNIILPESMISIGEDSFSGCESLVEITIPCNVKSIGCGAFSYCESLTNINIISANTNIEKRKIIKDMPILVKVFLTLLKLVSSLRKNNPFEDNNMDTFDHCKYLKIRTVRGGKAWKFAEKNKIKHEDLKNNLNHDAQYINKE